MVPSGEAVSFGIRFGPSSIITMAILYIINSVQAIGDFTATWKAALAGSLRAEELSGGIIGNGRKHDRGLHRRPSDGDIQPECRNCGDN